MIHVDFSHGANHYRLTDRVWRRGGVVLPSLTPARGVIVLRGAFAGARAVLATEMRRAFAGIDGGRAGAPVIPPAMLAERFADRIKAGAMALMTWGPTSSSSTGSIRRPSGRWRAPRRFTKR